MIEKMLDMLFDYQRIAQNPRLAQIIDETGKGRREALSEEDLQMVAGGVGLLEQNEDEKKPGVSFPQSFGLR